MTKDERALFNRAIEWIAVNDNEGGGDSVETISEYISTAMIADIFEIDPLKVAKRIKTRRLKRIIR